MIKLVLCGLLPQARTNTLIGQNIPKAQSSCLWGWPRASHKDRIFLGMCQVWAAQDCWINSFLYSNQLPPNLVAWNNNIYYLAAAVGWESSCRLSGSSPSVSLRGGKMLARDIIISGYTSKFTHSVVGKIHFLMGSWTESVNSSLAIGQEQSSVPCHVNLSSMTACFLKENKPGSQKKGHKSAGRRKGASKMEVIVCII